MGKAYRSGLPYRKHNLYNGTDTAPPVGIPSLYSLLSLPWSDASPREKLLSLKTVTPAPQSLSSSLEWDRYNPYWKMLTINQRTLATHYHETGLNWGTFLPYHREFEAPFNQIAEHGSFKTLPWNDYGLHLSHWAELPYDAVIPARGQMSTLPYNAMEPHHADLESHWQALLASSRFSSLPWTPIRARQYSTTTRFIIVPPESDQSQFLVFPVYAMIPTFSVVTLPDRTPVHVTALSLSTDLDSWAWTVNGSLPASQLPLISPEGLTQPMLIEVEVNGYVWVFAVEDFSDNSRFGTRMAQFSGRSQSAALSKPYAIPRNFVEDDTRLAVQLVEQELPSGWSVDYDTVDWSIPGGTFAYQSLDPIEAILKVVNSIGSILQSHPSDQELIIRPRYGVSPWEWNDEDPQILVPASVMMAKDGTWEGGSNANGVYVYAEQTGFSGFVQITGTNGVPTLAQVVDPLLVSADPVRERGRIELARSGVRKTEVIPLPLFPPPMGSDNPGLIEVGKLMEFTNHDGQVWRGQSMAVNINVNKSDGRALTVRQNITVERQYR